LDVGTDELGIYSSLTWDIIPVVGVLWVPPYCTVLVIMVIIRLPSLPVSESQRPPIRPNPVTFRINIIGSDKTLSVSNIT